MPNWKIAFTVNEDDDFVLEKIVSGENPSMALDVLMDMYPDDDLYLVYIKEMEG